MFDKLYKVNSYLCEKIEIFNVFILEKFICYFNVGEYELREFLDECLKCCECFVFYIYLLEYCNVMGEKFVNGNIVFYNELVKFVNGYGINFLELKKFVNVNGVIKRM